MNFWLNEYFKFSFELNIELNHFCARFNVWLNNRNVSDRATQNPTLLGSHSEVRYGGLQRLESTYSCPLYMVHTTGQKIGQSRNITVSSNAYSLTPKCPKQIWGPFIQCNAFILLYHSWSLLQFIPPRLLFTNDLQFHLISEPSPTTFFGNATHGEWGFLWSSQVPQPTCFSSQAGTLSNYGGAQRTGGNA